MHLIAVFLQVVLDAALEEVQLGLQLLREAKHAVFTPGQVGVVAQEAQPKRKRRKKGRRRVTFPCRDEQILVCSEAKQTKFRTRNVHSRQ